MNVLCLIFILNAFVITCLSQDCPDEPEIPEGLQRIPRPEFREQDELQQILWDDWFNDTKRKRRDVDTEVILKDYNRVKRQGPDRCTIRRKEYRQMTRNEMRRWHRCLRRMKNGGDFDLLTFWHQGEFAPGAHAGVAFLPWHRIFLWEFERRMRQYRGCRRAFVPYWDSALDQPLPVHSDSVLWTRYFWGNHGGTVTSGPARNWPVIPGCEGRGAILYRVITGNGNGLYTREKILNMYPPMTFKDFVLRRFENQLMLSRAHGSHHCYYGCPRGGSHVAGLKCSPSDPVFWMLHSMVDYIWDEWSRLPGRTMVYPEPGVDGVTLEDMSNRGDPNNHLADSLMLPFNDTDGTPLIKRDGLRRKFNCPYRVRPSKDKCTVDADCGSPQGLLFCSSCETCLSKIREGGRCDHQPDRACYCPNGGGRCARDICECP